MRRQRTRDVGNRAANMVSRVMLNTTDDSTGIQGTDAIGFSTEELPELEHVHPYGLSSRSMPPTGQRGQRQGPEGIVVYPTGDRSHGVVVVAGDRRHRRRNMQQGEVALHGPLQGGQQSYVHIYGDRIEISVPADKKLLLKVGNETSLTMEDGSIKAIAGNAKAVLKKNKCAQIKKVGDSSMHITCDIENSRICAGKVFVTIPDPFGGE